MSKKGRYVELIRLHILVNCMELRWRQPCSDPVAPCVIKKGEERRKKKREVLHLFRCYTHTHPKRPTLHQRNETLPETTPNILTQISGRAVSTICGVCNKALLLVGSAEPSQSPEQSTTNRAANLAAAKLQTG